MKTALYVRYSRESGQNPHAEDLNCHKKAQKAQSTLIICTFCAFLWAILPGADVRPPRLKGIPARPAPTANRRYPCTLRLQLRRQV